MLASENAAFAKLIAGVYEFYGKEPSEFTLGVWWQAMQQFDLVTVREALGRHTMNPDTGQFLPRPADVVRMIGGTTNDAALVAWTALEIGIRHVGTYETVAFDDALIHRVVEDMGGWILMGRTTEKELPFKRKEFTDRYRAYKLRGEVPEYPRKLTGIFDGQNLSQGFPARPVKLIGNEVKAAAVLHGGSDQSRLKVSQVAAALPALADRVPA